MNHVTLIFTFIFISLLSGCATTKQDERVCPKVFIHSDKSDFELSDTEKRLICGDPEEDAYKLIPSYQASYMLTGFLQSKGYSTPRFEYEGDLLHVYPGKQSFVEKIIVVSDHEDDSKMVEKEMFRKFKGEIITPKLLDAIEAPVTDLFAQQHLSMCQGWFNR